MVVAAGRSAYLVRLRLPVTAEAEVLARELSLRGASVEREHATLTVIWPASDADDVGRWSDYQFPELVFFLRAWAGANLDRQAEVLEERPLVAGC